MIGRSEFPRRMPTQANTLSSRNAREKQEEVSWEQLASRDDFLFLLCQKSMPTLNTISLWVPSQVQRYRSANISPAILLKSTFGKMTLAIIKIDTAVNMF